jgi:D-arabinose 5-phosphate isomerase GutQ
MSSQPMGSLFEQGMFLLLDALIVMLMEKRDVNADEMFDRHANLE